jgi:SNF2 family DNA or RNA helicase
VDLIINKKVLVIISPETFRQDSHNLEKACKWDIMVIDEGHRAKNVASKLR